MPLKLGTEQTEAPRSVGVVEMGWTHGMNLVSLWEQQALEGVETSIMSYQSLF